MIHFESFLKNLVNFLSKLVLNSRTSLCPRFFLPITLSCSLGFDGGLLELYTLTLFILSPFIQWEGFTRCFILILACRTLIWLKSFTGHFFLRAFQSYLLLFRDSNCCFFNLARLWISGFSSFSFTVVCKHSNSFQTASLSHMTLPDADNSTQHT